MASSKKDRASMREGPLAALFRKTDEVMEGEAARAEGEEPQTGSVRADAPEAPAPTPPRASPAPVTPAPAT
ncbi:MAG: hypothetical protein JWO90_1818, partial [Solirubrobacterales bacterium]|nr:hypothetical protein [Solirubrobacterales bacterium]